MTNAPTSGCADCGAPTPPILPPATFAYRRTLVPGRGVSVYYDRHPPNEWGEHVHEQVQAAAVLDAVEFVVRWKTLDGIWHEMTIQGPAIWIVPAGIPHTLQVPKETDMVTLFMNRSFVSEIVGREVTDVLTVPFAQLRSRDPVIGQLCKTFRGLCRGHEQGHPLYVESIGTVLGTHILQAIHCSMDKHTKRGGLPAEILRVVMRHIDEHLAEPIRLNTLSRLAGMCRSRFTELFKRSVGFTAHAYVMRRRVAQAEEYLETTDMKEIDIATMCGFSDDTMMARWFRRVLDCTPRDIRANRPK